jgi:hypothetical protein
VAFPPLSRLLDRKQAPWVLLALGVLGLGTRLLLAANSTGSNDIGTWSNFSQLIAVYGVEWMYRSVPGFNHPPLMGWWSLAALKLAIAQGWRFDPCFKLLPIAAEAGSAMLLFSIWRKRGQRFATGALAFAAFAWNLDSLLVSGYHGNTDSLAAMFALLACWLIEEHAAPFAAGLALAAAINVKLIPVLLIPVLAVRVKSPRDLVRLGAGLAIGTVPYFPMFLTSWEGFSRNAISYNSNFDNWGLAFFVNRGEASTALHDVFAAIHPAFAFAGRYLIIGGVLAACAFSRWKKVGDAYQLAAIAFGLFLVLTPGFGVQYTVYVVPVLFAASLRWGMAYATAAGAFIFSVYFHFWNRAVPLESIFTTPYPLPSALLGLLPWAMLIAFLVIEVRRLRAQAAHG